VTADERLDRIEHLTAGIAEERKKDREEYKTLWRDGQRQINELAHHIGQLAVETRIRFEEIGQRIEQLAEESRAEDKRLGERIGQLDERIDKLVSAIGQLVAKP
jgi:DNA anti-recombination protein RmuC